DDLGKLKPKADIGIFIGYSKSSRGFRTYNRGTRKIIKTIHVKFDELTTMASKCKNLEPGTLEVSTDFDAPNTINNKDTPSTSSIIIDDNEGPQIVSTYEEPTSSISNDIVDESFQEDTAELNRNTFMNPLSSPVLEENHTLEQVIGDPSKPVMTRSRLNIDAEMCMYALTVSTIEPKNIKESMLDHSWIKSIQDELHQFQILNVWDLVKRPVKRNMIGVKWLWKNNTDAQNIVIRNKSRIVSKGYHQEEGIHFEESFFPIHQSHHGIFISHSQYTLEILKKHGIDGCDSISTPIATTKIDADLQAYSDANHTGCRDDFKSTSGEIQFLGDKLVSWSSKKQDCTAMSTAEAKQHMWDVPISAVEVEYRGVANAVVRLIKHIETCIHFVRDSVVTGQVRMLHVHSRCQYIDIFTKGIPNALFDEFPSSLSRDGNEPSERKPRKGQNQIKTGQKREACRSREKFKAVTVGRGRKTEQNIKRMAKNAKAIKSYSSLKE
nr:retrovirus-related Pol polyprotein from transposon TNT 1-94 [Tanacetum cinerariifolium]